MRGLAWRGLVFKTGHQPGQTGGIVLPMTSAGGSPQGVSGGGRNRRRFPRYDVALSVVMRRPGGEVLLSTGDVSRQTRSEVMAMLPSIAEGVNVHNKERGYRG